MRELIRKWRIQKLYLELGIIGLGAVGAGVAIWIFDAWPYLVNWAWFIAGMFFGAVVLLLIVAFFAFGARGEGPTSEEHEARNLPKRRRPKPRLVQNGKPPDE